MTPLRLLPRLLLLLQCFRMGLCQVGLLLPVFLHLVVLPHVNLSLPMHQLVLDRHLFRHQLVLGRVQLIDLVLGFGLQLEAADHRLGLQSLLAPKHFCLLVLEKGLNVGEKIRQPVCVGLEDVRVDVHRCLLVASNLLSIGGEHICLDCCTVLLPVLRFEAMDVQPGLVPLALVVDPLCLGLGQVGLVVVVHRPVLGIEVVAPLKLDWPCVLSVQPRGSELIGCACNSNQPAGLWVHMGPAWLQLGLLLHQLLLDLKLPIAVQAPPGPQAVNAVPPVPLVLGGFK
mmetsp:Transcript_13195/g.37189  ORF Transcript_13195/g.37189 Transcript_13195/m.37189 type:complete len:285 (+) Transcript_13195:1814-2668(+)